MKRLDIHGVIRRKVKKTTVLDKSQPRPKDKVNRKFRTHLHLKLPRQIQRLLLLNPKIELGRCNGLVTQHDLAGTDVARLAVD